jgi:hypothetical protein
MAVSDAMRGVRGRACHDVLVRKPLAIALVTSVAACGTHAATSAFPDASVSFPRDSEVLDGPFPCGPQPGQMCEPTQYCMIGCNSGGPILCFALLDGGACPPGSELSPNRSLCPYDAAPCVSVPAAIPTMCIVSLDAAACELDDVPVGEGSARLRTFGCVCQL